MSEDEDPNIISKMEKKKAYTKKEVLNTDTDYTKYAVGGEPKEVPATGPEENRNLEKRVKKQ